MYMDVYNERIYRVGTVLSTDHEATKNLMPIILMNTHIHISVYMYMHTSFLTLTKYYGCDVNKESLIVTLRSNRNLNILNYDFINGNKNINEYKYT